MPERDRPHVESRQAPPTRKLYRAPKLTSYGPAIKLTQGNSSKAAEGHNSRQK